MCGSTTRSRLHQQQQHRCQQYKERYSGFGVPKLYLCTQNYLLVLLVGLCYCQLPALINAQATPVIGGLCDLGAAEVQIGGKQTQFFLKCEANQDSASGKGVWVVKSRNAASPTAIPQPSTTLPPANTEPQQHPKQVRKQPAAAYCAQELNAREADSCTAAVTCLQRNNEDATSFLQCDQSNNRWIKKSCSDGNIFSFEHQACITNPKAQNRHYARYSTGSQGVVCTFTQCSNSNPCNQGTCNNGYCCTSGSYQPSAVDPKTDLHNKSSQSSDKTEDIKLVSNDWPIGPPGIGFPPELANLDSILIKATGDGRACAAGFKSSLKCSAAGECPPGLFCDPSLSHCCPLLLPANDNSNTADQYTHSKRLSPKSYGSYPTSFSPSSVAAAAAPAPIPLQSSPVSGGSLSSTTACTAGCPRGYSGCCGTQQASCCLRQQCPGGVPSTGRSCFRSCPTGQVCVSGVCCPQTSSQVLMCPNGGQAYGSCMNGYCSPGYQCMQSTGMCCPVAQQSYVQVCPMGGSPMGSCISGTCSQGYRCVRSSNLCCPSSSTNPFVCPDGTQAVGACINGQCGSGFACVNGLCCNNTSQSPRCLDGSQAVGACINGRCGSGYICTTGNICCRSTSLQLCPSGEESIGPCINDLCPSGYSCVNDQCCPGASFTCAADAFIAGPCINDACMVGFSCDTTLNRCCPTGTLLGQCVNDACPTGYTCYPTAAEAANTGATQMCYAVCDGDTTAFVGNAVNDVCPINTVKKLNACCQQFRRHRSPERKSALIASYSEPLPDILSMNPLGACPGGIPAVSGCMNGLCGVGFECINNLCCAYSNRNNFMYNGSGLRFNDAEPVEATSSNSTKLQDASAVTVVSSTSRPVEEQKTSTS